MTFSTSTSTQNQTTDERIISLCENVASIRASLDVWVGHIQDEMKTIRTTQKNIEKKVETIEKRVAIIWVLGSMGLSLSALALGVFLQHVFW